MVGPLSSFSYCLLHIQVFSVILCSHVFGLVCCFTSYATAMVMWERSVHLTTIFFLDKLEQAVNQYFVYILSHEIVRMLDVLCPENVIYRALSEILSAYMRYHIRETI